MVLFAIAAVCYNVARYSGQFNAQAMRKLLPVLSLTIKQTNQADFSCATGEAARSVRRQHPSVGPLEVNVGELLGKNVYSPSEKVPLGTISDVTLSAGGDVKNIIVTGPAEAGQHKLYTVDWNSVDVQPAGNGGVQVLIRATKDEIENHM